MGDYQVFTPKYVVRVSFEVEGVVEKSDVIGALFGQTEGLFGTGLDLRELQNTGRIGRIEIDLESKQDKTTGKIMIPSSLDKPSTALMAAAIESVERIGPCASKVVLDKIEDYREKKRGEIVERAKKILRQWTAEDIPSTDKILKEVLKAAKPANVTTFGPEKLSAGPDVASSESIVVVEGRADVANLLKSGIRNTIASEGAKIPETIIKLSKDKEITAFLDGDRGGDLILKGLMQVADVEYVARAPPGKEVENLLPTEIQKALSSKISVKEKQTFVEKPKRVLRKQVSEIKITPISDTLLGIVSNVNGTLEAVLLNNDEKQIERIPVNELFERIQKVEGVHTIVFDGIITQRLVDIAGEKGIKRIIGDRISGVAKRPVEMQLMTSANIPSQN